MKKLLEQIMKFGIVGVICFFIDYIIGLIGMNIALRILGEGSFAAASTIGSILGFTVSVVCNYILSFKFVFQRKENMDRRAEFIIFLILSIIGLGINSLIVWSFTGPIYSSLAWLRSLLDYNMAYTGGKVIATAVVMVYNFVTRKKFLEQKSED